MREVAIMEENKLLEFVPFKSCINPSFWHKLSEIKLNVDKLNEKVRKIWGYYSNIEDKCILEVDSTSFNRYQFYFHSVSID